MNSRWNRVPAPPPEKVPPADGYDFQFTAHALKRGSERFGADDAELRRRLDSSCKVSSKLRKLLRRTTQSKRHLACLENGSGFFFRIHKGMVFVLDNLRVVTVFAAPSATESNEQEG